MKYSLKLLSPLSLLLLLLLPLYYYYYYYLLLVVDNNLSLLLSTIYLSQEEREPKAIIKYFNIYAFWNNPEVEFTA